LIHQFVLKTEFKVFVKFVLDVFPMEKLILPYIAVFIKKLVRLKNRPGRADLETCTASLPPYSSAIPESGFCDTLVEEEAVPTRVFRTQSPEECLPWPPHITWSHLVLLSSLSAQVNCLVLSSALPPLNGMGGLDPELFFAGAAGVLRLSLTIS
jgi:hypothetical protein